MTLTDAIPWTLHFASCRQHTSTFTSLSCSHTSVLLPEKLSTFQFLNLFSNLLPFCNPEILCTPCPLKSYWGMRAYCCRLFHNVFVKLLCRAFSCFPPTSVLRHQEIVSYMQTKSVVNYMHCSSKGSTQQLTYKSINHSMRALPYSKGYRL